MSLANPPNRLLEKEYQQRLKVNQLRREVYWQSDPAISQVLLDKLHEAEKALDEIEQERIQAQDGDPHDQAVVVDTRESSGQLGAETTGLETQVYLRMAQVPTSIYHLLNPAQHPLISCQVRNAKKDDTIRRVRVISFIEGYSAQAVDTVELKPHTSHTFDQLPTMFPDRLQNVTELTRATLNVMLEDMDGKVELHKTRPIWLLARTTAYMDVWDPKTRTRIDLSQYLGAFVTPNAPALMKFLRIAAERHSDKSLDGYQGKKELVELQVKAMFDALKKDAGITYVNSVTAFSPENGFKNQRVRLPRESLQDKQANCLDGTVLFASLLEGISLSPAIILVPEHAFVAWETWEESNEWRYLETTMIRTHSFKDACRTAQNLAEYYKSEAERTKDPSKFRLWPLRELRTAYRITPME